MTRANALLSLCLATSVGMAGCNEFQSIEAPTESQPTLREIVIEGAPAESSEGQGFGGAERTHRDLIDAIEQSRTDENITGLFLRFGDLGSALGRATELAASLAHFRKAGKPVHCHFEGTDNTGYYVMAQGCDKIGMTPAGMLNLVGMHAELLYARDLLDTVGIKPELMHVGKYKGAADMLTETGMPAEARASMDALLDDLQHELLRGLEVGRAFKPDAAMGLIDQGPFDAERARTERLVDTVAYDDEARSIAKAAAKADVVRVLRVQQGDEPEGVVEIFKALTKERAHASSDARVVIAHLDGNIQDGHSSGTRSADADTFVRAMRRFADDKQVKAVVLRIDSPGGSALASDRMWHAARRVAKRKPLIVSVGDMAASGGYYVASAGTRIFASDNSILGSIGVVGGKLSGAELLKKLGVQPVVLRRGKSSAWSSFAEPWTADEQKTVRAMMEHTYETFLERVAEGRGVDVSKIAPLAEGRVMSGLRAREGGLVDQAGGLADAIAYARTETKLGPDSPVEVWPPEQSLMEQVAHLFTGGDETAVAASYVPGAERLMRSGLVQWLASGESGAACVVPFALDIR